MKIETYEGIVEDGCVRLPIGVRLPEKARVYVVVPGVEVRLPAYLASPHLAHPEQVADFEKQVFEEESDAGL